MANKDAKVLAKYIMDRYANWEQNTSGYVISSIKLQKSLYFLFAYWGSYIRINKQNIDSVEVDYSKYDDFLFDDKIEAWTYGPVVPNVFNSFKNGELNNIDAEEIFYGEAEKKEFIDNLLNQIFEIDDFGLVRLAHEDKCWKKNYKEYDSKHNNEISKEEIISEYISKSLVSN